MVMKEMSFQTDDFLRPSKENVRLKNCFYCSPHLYVALDKSVC